jgi:serine protease Do
MKRYFRAIEVGLALGVAAFVAFGLFTVIAARKALPPEAAMTPGPIDQATVEPAQKLGDAFAMIAAHVKPAVVSVFSERAITVQNNQIPSPFGNDPFFRQFFGNQAPQQMVPSQPKQYKQEERGMGSGMIIDEDGHVLTNYHVVRGEDHLQVQLADKRQYDADVVSTDPKTDVAIIQLKGDYPKDLPTVQLGDSDALRSGDLVMAVGAPFGFQQTVTTGIISATGRSNVGIEAFEDFLQTDCPINPGNSGGPLVNMEGQVIGMNTAIATSVGQFAGVGFSIPVNLIKTMLPTLVKGGTITRGMLGVEIQDVTKDLADQFGLPNTNGALVSQVVPDSPAEKAGIKPGDVIVEFAGKSVTDTTQLRNLVAATSPGTKTPLKVFRDGETLTLTVDIGVLANAAPGSSTPSETHSNELAKLGLTVQQLTPDLANQLGIQEQKGVVITEVEPGTPASLAGLQPGDIITQVNRQSVTNVDELQSALSKNKKDALFLINRKGQSLFVVLSLQTE